MPELVDVAPGSPEWLAARRAGVTATDIVAIAGLSATESAYSLYHRKVGNLPDAPDTDRWRLGRELEPYIADRWQEAERTGEPGERTTTMKLFRFACGHVGRDNEPPYGHLRAKVRAFIRVAEIRNHQVEEIGKNCPDCR